MFGLVGRKRTRDFDLPPRLYRRGGAYYYVAGNKWTALGSNLAVAKRRWADLEYVAEQRTVADLVARYLDEKTDRLAPATVRQYRSFGNTIREQWGALPCASLRAPAIAQWRDRRDTGRIWANGVISVLRNAYRCGIEWGWCELNPADAVQFNPGSERRGRYLTDAEFRRIRGAAPAWLVTAMDVAYLTALRPSDVLALRWEQIGERLTVLPQKTSRSGVAVAYELTPELRAVLEAARTRPVVGLYVVATDRGRPIRLGRLQKEWLRIVRSLGIADCQFRDIRAKAGTDADAAGQDAQALLHHASRKMTSRYLKLGEVRKAEPVRRKL